MKSKEYNNIIDERNEVVGKIIKCFAVIMLSVLIVSIIGTIVIGIMSVF